MTTGKRTLAAIACAFALMGAAGWWWLKGDDPLDSVHQGIAAQYPEVAHITAQELSAMPPGEVILFDTREAEEFAVSHLNGAIRIAPELPPEQFLAQYGQNIGGRTAIFYCSVGARSSAFAARVQGELLTAGAARVVNLEKGLFGWHNDGLPQLDGAGQETDFIHPFNAFWGRLIKRSDLIAPTAKNS